ncbi:MAG TPA: chemotaxis protein CheW, partial [Magnetococcales bacterium]|nr:chemotaxis protein CheW [Magnetococcales bacterium]
MLFLSFNLSTEIYAVETIRVREVLQFCKITRVPRAGAQVCGVVNLRGSIITVFDLRTILGMEKSVPTQHSNIVVLEYPHAGEVQVQAFLVDSVSEVLEIESSHLNSSPAARLGGKKYVRNMARSAHGFILILDVAGLFGFEVKDEAVKLPSALSADIGDPELQSGGPSAKVDFQKTPAFSEASPDLSREEIVQTVGKAGGILAPENGGENVGSQEESVATLSGDDIETTTTGKTMTWDGGDVSMSMTVRDEHSAEEQARLLEGGGLAAMAEVLEKSGTLEGAEVLQVASDPSKALTFQDTGEVLPMSVEKEKL